MKSCRYLCCKLLTAHGRLYEGSKCIWGAFFCLAHLMAALRKANVCDCRINILMVASVLKFSVLDHVS